MGKKAEWCEAGEYWPKVYTGETLVLLERVAPRKFHDMMDSRMLVSHHKYGDSEDGYPEKAVAMNNVFKRLELYVNTGNAEYLIDAANFCMLEWMHPSVKNAFMKATDSDESPGILYRDGEASHGNHLDVEVKDLTKVSYGSGHGQ